MKKIIYAVILVLMFATIGWSVDAGTVAVTEETFSYVKKIGFAWTTTSGGSAVKTTSENYTGQIVRLVTVPSAAPDAPTTLYGVIVADEDGNDVLMGATVQGGATGRSATATEQVNATSLGYVANDKLTLTIQSGGNAKKGVVYLYIR